VGLIVKIVQMRRSNSILILKVLKEVQISQQLDHFQQWYFRLKMLFTLLAGIIKKRTFINLISLVVIGKLMKISLFEN
jgi:hypothetical protein